MNSAKQEAFLFLDRCITDRGFLASPNDEDNYRRVWARDGVMAGIASVLHHHTKGIEALENTLDTLFYHQANDGQIPSNISIDNRVEVSYGSLVGRVDATTWWLVGAGVYLLHSGDQQKKKQWENAIQQAIKLLDSWCFNQRGLIYTPLGGNWADEYISTGYVLYDQLLHYWSLLLMGRIYEREDWRNHASYKRALIQANFSDKGKEELIIHRRAHDQCIKNSRAYMWFQFGPQGYEDRWDMSANALAVLLGFEFDYSALVYFLEGLKDEIGSWMLPAFYPVITPNNDQWKLLAENYSYSFKNRPHHFHNGGSWPIFNGWLCLAMRSRNLTTIADKIHHEMKERMGNGGMPFRFWEYWSTDNLQGGGKSTLLYSATGLLFCELSLTSEHAKFFQS